MRGVGANGGDSVDAGLTTDAINDRTVVVNRGADATPPRCSLPANAARRWLAFDSDRADGNRDIYVVRADGSQLVRLTTDPSIEKDPAFSHDGRSLAFASNRGGAMQVYVMDLATSGVRKLTSSTLSADQPSWSHDDRRIAFRGSGHRDAGPYLGPVEQSVYVINADGTAPHAVVHPNRPQSSSHPSFSLDDAELLSDRSNGIDAVRVDGTGARHVLEPWTTTIETPALSPDGVSVAYAIYCTSERIAITPFAGRNIDDAGFRLCQSTFVTAAFTRRPAWGPDGVIAFEQLRPVDVGGDAAARSWWDAGEAHAPRTVVTRPGGEEHASIAVVTGPGPEACVIALGGPGDNRNPSWAPAGFQPTR